MQLKSKDVKEMTIHPNCKINLGLNIVARRPDGYHDIETVFYPVPLRDTLTVEPAEEDCLIQEGIPVEGDPMDNLVMRVLRLLRDEGCPIPPLRVTLEKRIPSGAGLGGGSSDAAAMMQLLNEQFRLGLSIDKMSRLVSRLGADCAFFILNRPVFAQGIGDRMEPIDISLKGWWLTLVKPDIFVSTREAYSSVTPQRPDVSVRHIVSEPVETWRHHLTNDFEGPVFSIHPEIGRIKDELYRLGATYASMSGSGSSVFALSRDNIINKNFFSDCFCFECPL